VTLFDQWCNRLSAVHNGHPFDLLTEKPNIRDAILPELVSVLHDNYDARSRFLERAARLGYDLAVEVIRNVCQQPQLHAQVILIRALL
jgi:hypothetical protein